MSDRKIVRDSTSQSWFVKFLDASGNLVTGKTYSDITSMGFRRYQSGREVTEITSTTPAVLANKAAGYSAGGFVEDSDSLGRYRYDPANAAFETGADSADNVEPILACSGVSHIVFERVWLVDFDPFATAERDANLTKWKDSVPADLEDTDKVSVSLQHSGVAVETDTASREASKADVSGLSTHSASDVWSDGTRTLTGFGTLVSDVANAVWGAGTRTLSAFGFSVTASNMRGTDGANTVTPPTVSAIVDGVWDEAEADHTTVGTFGNRLNLLSTFMAGITSLANWLGALAGKTADASTEAEINSTTAGAGYNITTDSLEAQKDVGVTINGADIRAALGMSSDDMDDQLEEIVDNVRYGLAVLCGSISNANNSSETFQITVGEETYTVSITGLTEAGNRTGQTLSKT